MRHYKNIRLLATAERCFCYSVILLLTACTNRNTAIEGTLPSEEYDQQVVYWLPMEGEHPKPVDSTFIQKNTFRLVITPCNYNKMGILRMRPEFRLDMQELLVLTEEGRTTHVKLDSISSAWGTPLNDVLQHWKERRQIHLEEIQNLRKKYRDANVNEQDSINETIKNLYAVYRDDVFQIVTKNKNNEIGRFLYFNHKSFFTPEQIQELENEMKEFIVIL